MEQASAFNGAELAGSPAGTLPYVGVRAQTLAATPTGTTDTGVANFTGTVFSNPSGRGPLFSVTTTAAAGTVIRALPGAQGRYLVRARVNVQTAGTVYAGLSLGNPTSPITANPSLATASIRDVAQSLQAGADEQSIELTTVWEIDVDAANAPTPAELRLILTNGAGAAPAAADLVLAQCMLEVMYLGQAA